MSQVRGILYFIGLTFGAVGSFLILVPWSVLMPLNFLLPISRFRRSYLCVVSKLFFSFAAVMIENICGTKIYIHSFDPRVLDDKGVLMISNHRTRVDWMYGGWSYATLLNIYPQMAFILKRSLKDVPFYGWCMQIMMYIFLERKRDADLPKIQKVLSYLLSHDKYSSIFIFPEGTDLSHSNIAKNDKFATDNNLPRLEYVLYPKPAGFLTCLDLYRKYRHVSTTEVVKHEKKSSNVEETPVLHDITLAYRDYIIGKRTTDMSIVKGEFPLSIHMLVNRVELKSIPVENAAASQWLRNTFLQKEKVLKSFYTHPSIAIPSAHHHHHNRASKHFNDKEAIENWPSVIYCSSQIPFTRRIVHWLGVPTYTFLTFGLLYYSAAYRWIVLILCILYALSPLFNGFDTLELMITDNEKLSGEGKNL